MLRIAAAAVFAGLLLSSSIHHAGSSCGSGGLWGSDCSASTDGSQVNVGGSQHSSGSGGPDSDTGAGGDGGGNGGGSPVAEEELITEICDPTDVTCRGGGFTVEMLPDVTASDLTSFVPARPSFSSEPGGVGIVGMPANFVASAVEQTQAGTLFDRPVSVRFVPAAYVFDFGDGSSARSVTGGASWASLGQPQFTATPTSHAYGARGSYLASVAVEYAAAVDFGTGWRPVIGTVTAPGGTQGVDVYEARTALVDRTCGENPKGPGC